MLTALPIQFLRKPLVVVTTGIAISHENKAGRGARQTQQDKLSKRFERTEQRIVANDW